MRRNRLSLILILGSLALSILVASQAARPVNAVTNNSHVIAQTSDHYVFESSYQNPGFYANGLYWVFYEDSNPICEGQGGCFYYVTSPDGTSWSGATQVKTPGNSGIHVTDSDWSVVNSGTQVFYARYNESSFDTNCNRALLFGSGTISGGSITWQPEQVVRSPSSTETFPSEVISVDSNNQVWIGYLDDSQKACGSTGNEAPHIVHQNTAILPTAPLSSSFIVSNPDPTPILQSVNFNATSTGGTPGYTYSWNFGDGVSGTGQNVTHTYGSAGTFTVTLETIDSSSPPQRVNSTEMIPVDVVPSTNLPPQLAVPPSRSVRAGSAVVFPLSASDTDGETVTVTTSTLPSGATFVNSTRQFSWTPTESQANQTWTITFNATDSGGLSVTKQVLIDVSPLWSGDISLPFSSLSQSISANWHVDIAPLSGGQVYAGYWADNYPLFGRLFDGSNWQGEDLVSLTTESTDVNSFIFGSGSTVYAVYFDTNKGTLNAGIKPPGKTWEQNVIDHGEAKSVCGLPGNVSPSSSCPNQHRYSLPFTASYDLTSGMTYVFWYNQTNNVIDEWSGSGALWRLTSGAFSTQASGPEYPITSFHYSTNVNNKDSWGIIWIDGVNAPYRVNFGLETVNPIPSFSTDASWNPLVHCTPILVSVEQILGGQDNSSSGGATESGSIFNPGIQAKSPGDAKRWLTASSFTNTLSGWQPGPFGQGTPCTITNADGQIVSAFVEVRGVQRGPLLNEDLSVNFDPVNGGGPFANPKGYNDTTFNIFTPGYDVCTATNTTGCMHTIHMEFDHDWKAAGYCGPSTVCDPYQLAAQTSAFKSLMDFQGFIYWDPDHANAAEHSFSGWEIHPITGWRLSCQGGQFCGQAFTLSSSPTTLTIVPGQKANSTITINTFNLFSGPLPLSATVTPTNPSDPTANLTPSTVIVPPCNACAAANSTLTVTAGSSSSGTYIVTVTGTNGTTIRTTTVAVNVQGFSLSANPKSVSIPAGQSENTTITLTSLGSFSGPVDLSASATGCTCGFQTKFSPARVNLSVGGTATAILTMTAGSTTGNAVLTVTGNSSSLTSSTTVSVSGVDFTVTSNPATANVLTNRLANSTITVAGVNGFTGTVSLSDTVPASLTCSLGPTSILLNSTTTSGRSSLSCSGPPGNYTVIITGLSSGVIHTTTVSIKVQDFTVTANPTGLEVNINSPGSSTIQISAINGFTGTIALSQNGGSACNLSGSSVTLTSTTTSASVTLNCTYTATGNTSVLVTSTFGPLIHATSVTFQAVDFTIAASPTSFTVNAGSLTNSTITLGQLNGFNRTVTLTINPQSGLVCSLSANSINLATSQTSAFLSCKSGTAGNYSVTVTGTNTNLSHTTGSIQVQVVDFEVTPNISSLSLSPGGTSTTSSIHLTSLNFFTGTVTISIIVSPSVTSGPTATPGLNSLKLTPAGNSTGLTINAGQVAGVYSLNITATNGQLTRSAIITLTVTNTKPGITTSLSASTILAGGSVTDSATLTGATSTAGGTVTYYLSASGTCAGPTSFISTVTVTNGIVPSSRSVFFNATGTYGFNATYSGDNNNAPASSHVCESLTVQKDNPTIATTLTPNTLQVGQSAIDSATLTGFFQASGTVNYNLFIGSNACTGPSSTVSTLAVTNGVVPSSRSVQFNDTNPGGYSFQAGYSGDSNNNAATSPCEPLAVNPVGVTVATSLSSNTITVGGTVSDSATLSGQTSTAGGTVTYNEFPNSICSAPSKTVSIATVTNGVVAPSRSVFFNSTGTFSLNAVYSGDTNNNGATSACQPLTVNKASPNISTSISPQTTIIVGSSITDGATITGGYPASGVTGTVTYTFYSFSTLPSSTAQCSSGTPVGSPQTVTITAGNSVPVSGTVTPPSAGFYGFSATYNGDGNNTATTGNCEPLTVNKQTPTITTAVTPSSSVVVGTSAADQATITGGFPASGITGTVTYNFFGPSNGICSGAPASSQVVTVGTSNTVPVSSPHTLSSVGSYSFNATYSGDADNSPITSSCEPLTVSPITTTSTVVCGSSITVGVPTSCTVTVSDLSPGTLTPTGTVSWSTNSTGIFSPTTSCNLSGSTSSATCSVTYTPTLGAQNITATYQGDPSHRGSSGFLVITPGLHSTTTSVNCSSPVVVNQAATCTATVTDSSQVGPTTPTGSITFTLTSGVAGAFNSTSCSLRAASSATASCGVLFTPSASGSAGANISGGYGGDSTHSSSSGTTNIAINSRTTSTTVTCNTPVVVNQASTCTATVTDSSAAGTAVTPAGTVSFSSTGAAGGFTGSPCTLSGSGASATCIASFLDSTASGTSTISASYLSSNNVHGNSASSISSSITINPRSTTTSISCNSPVVISQASTCTATVTDSSAAGTSITPAGTVSFTQSSGTITGSPCTLASTTLGVASCTASFTSTISGTFTINGNYVPSGADTSHAGSSTTTAAAIVVNNRSTNTVVTCQPVNVGQATTCTATVTDTSPGTISTPGGVVTFAATGGSVTPTSGSCTLTAGSCGTTFTPQSFGTVTVNATYIGGDSIHSGSSGVTSLTPGLQSTATTINCLTPIIVNQGSTCTVTVSSTAGSGATTPTGSVVFSSGGFVTPTVTSCNLNAGGSCSVTLTGSAVGTASVVGNYTGDNGHTPSKNTVNITVNPRASSTFLSCTSSSVAVNASDSCTIYVKDTSAGTPIVPGGSVSLELDGASTGFTTCNLQTFNSTTASCTANYLPAPGTEGPHTLNANYAGDSTHLGSSSKTLALNVTTRTSSTTVNCTPPTVAVGQSVTCTATVKDTSTGTPITPSGLVNFSVTPSGSGSFTGTCSLFQSIVGTATCNIQYAASSTGSQTISGSYNGDTDHSAGSPGTFTLTVSVQSTATFVSCASTSVVVGTSDSCIVTVKDVPSGPSSTPASGTVSASLDSPSSFFANCQLASINATASSCTVTYTASSGTEGSHNIIATYSPDSSHGASSSSQTVLVTQRASTTTLLCSASSVTVGSNDPCTATIRDTSAGSPIAPTGGASFFLDASPTSFASCTSLTPLNSTSATCTVTFTPAAGSEGSHSITAKYSGDTDHSGSTSSASNVSAVQRTTSTGISCSPSTLSVGQATTCTATVRDTSTGTVSTPTGTVNFSVTPSGSGSFTGTCSLAESTPGTATCNISYTPSSTSAQTITGAYPGDTDHSSGQGTFSLNVNLQTTVTTVNCATTIAVNSADSCTVTVKDSQSNSASTSPTGSVSFTLDSSSTSFASCTLKVVNTTTANCNVAYTPALGTEGSHSITATYSPDATHSSSTGSTSVTATQRTTTTTVSCVSPVVVGQAAQCTATVTDSSGAGAASPSGSVSFTEAGVSGSLSAQSCSLIAGPIGASSCSVTFTGLATGTATVNGAYAPTDPDHSGSSTTIGGTTTINKRSTSTTVTCNSPVVVNQASTCTAVVSDNATAGTPQTPSGSVVFTTVGAGSISPSSCSLQANPDGTAGCSVSFARASTGTSTVSSNYGGDTTHSGGSSQAASITVNLRTTSLALSCATPVVVNQAGSCTATVTDTSPGTSATPTGSVILSTDSSGTFSNVCTLAGSGAIATCTANYTPSLIGTGTHAITAKYDGDSTHSTASPDATSSVTVNKRTTSTGISCTSSISVGSTGTCTVTVTDVSPGTSIAPSGTVSLSSNSTQGSFSGPCTLSGSTASATCQVNYTPTAGGHHDITAAFIGDAYHASSGPVSFNIATQGHPTDTTINCATPVVVNQASSCTATVTDKASTGATAPTGTVAFSESGPVGNVNPATCTLQNPSGSSASCIVSFTPSAAGTATITGSYAPSSTDTTHNASTSNSFAVTVTLRSTSTTIACSTPVVVNQASTCTVTVTDTSPSSSAQTPAGTVSLNENVTGSITGSPCNLVPGSTTGTASCAATFTASTSGGAGISATFTATDSIHTGSSTAAPAGITVNPRSTSTTLQCTSPVLVNVASTCTATVTDTDVATGITPTGTVTFSSTGSGSLSPNSCNLSGGTCFVSFTGSASGTVTVTAAYNGDTSHANSQSSPSTIAVNPRSTSTSITCATPIVINQQSTCTAIVTDTATGTPLTPTGTVTFTSTSSFSLSSTTCSLSNAKCSVTFTGTNIGNPSVTATYEGDSSHQASPTSSTMIAVGARITTTTISCGTTTLESPSTCTVTVTDTSPGTAITPSGTFALQTNSTGTFNKQCTLAGTSPSSGCTVTYTPTIVGAHQISANFTGDASHGGSLGTTIITPGLHSTVTSVSCSTPVVVNQASNCTVTVADTSLQGAAVPTGTVSLSSSGVSGSLSPPNCNLSQRNNTAASCNTSFTPASSGTASISGSYGGDASHNGSTSTPRSVVVNQRSTSIVVSCTTPVLVNVASTCSVTVSDSSPGIIVTPTGTVAFSSTGSGTLGSTSCLLSAGTCSSSFTGSAAGTPTVTGSYGGDSIHTGSQSTPANIVVNQRATTTTITCTTPVVVNQPSTCTATVVDNNSNGGTPVTPAGTVSFSETGASGSFTSSTCTLLAGTTGSASCTTSFTASAAGNAGIVGSYAPSTADTAHSSSPPSQPASITVNLRLTITTISCASLVVVNQASTCTATAADSPSNAGTSITPAGSIIFTESGTSGTFASSPCTLLPGSTLGTASCQASFTPTASGTANINATYAPTDQAHATSAATSTATVSVTLRVTTTSISCASPVVANQPATCTATVTDSSTNLGTPVTPSGTASFTASGTATGSFTSIACSLVPVSGSSRAANCSTTFTGSTTGGASISATYTAATTDTAHADSSSATSTITINPRNTTTTVSCSTPVVVGQSSTCTVTVADSSSQGSSLTPGGSVSFSESGVSGSFSGSPCILLQGSTIGTAVCTATFTAASNAGVGTVSTAYVANDNVHSGSSSTTSSTITVNPISTNTVLSCSSSATINTPASCVVTVSDTAPGTLTPTGTVSLSSNSTGTFNPLSPCNLSGSGASSTCSVTYTPNSLGHHLISANYQGDTLHSASGPATFLIATSPAPIHTTTTTVDCTPSSIVVNQVSSCTATVTDINSSPSSPSGTVTFSNSGSPGSLSPTSCTLVPSTASQSKCQLPVVFTPTASGSAVISADYGGDSTHSSSPSPGSSISVGLRTTTTTIVCPTPVLVNQASACIATVTDTSASGSPLTPAGTVSFSETGVSGTFSGSPCQLTQLSTGSASCSATFTAPSASGSATINGAYTPSDTAHGTSLSTPTSITIASRTTSTTVTCDTPVVVDQASTCTATVADTSTAGTPITPAGTVSFTSTGAAGSFTGSPCNLSGTGPSATCTASFLDPTGSGTAAISAGYTSSNNIHGNSASSISSGITINIRSTTTSVSCISPVVVDQASTCTATVTDSSSNPGTPITPSGSVSFSETGIPDSFTNPQCQLVSTPTLGIASCTDNFVSSATGTASVTVVYTPTDTAHSTSSTTASASITVSMRTTSTSLICASPVVVNQPSICTVTVTEQPSSAPSRLAVNGTVSFSQTGVIAIFSGPTCKLVQGSTVGVASCSTILTPSTVGTSAVTATYTGDNAHSGSNVNSAVTVNTRSTSTGIVCDSPVVIGQPSKCTVTVTDTSTQGTLITPTGTVTLSSTGPGTLSAQSCQLSTGSCTVSFTGSSSGTATVVGSYASDATHSSSVSTQATISVALRNTSTSVSCTPVNVNQTSTCTASVSDSSPGTVTAVPEGSINFSASGAPVSNTSANCVISSGGCSVTFTPKAQGAITITAVFVPSSSDTTFKGSQDSTTINPGAQSTSTNVVCPGSIVVSQGSTCTVTVESIATSGASSPTGSVSLTVNAYVSPLTTSCTLSPATGPSSTCSVQFTGSAAGSATITATYVGNSAYVTSHGSATLTVGLRTTSTTVSCDSPVAIGQTSTCTATVTDTSSTGTPITPAGTVSFSSSGTAGSFADSQCNLSGSGVAASCTATFLDSTVMESTTISASYASSDSVHSDSATTVGASIIVNQRQTSITISCQPVTTVVGNYTTCTATVSDPNPTTGTTPTGSVSFLNDTGTFATCTLSNGKCFTSYTPKLFATGLQTITGRYSGDLTHGTATGSTTITLAKRQTTIAVSCTSPVDLNQASTCTVTVTDVSPGSFAGPGGTVSFTSSVTTSSFSGNGTCLLVQSGSSSSCQISYTQTTNTSKPDIFGTYPGDSNHSGSTGKGSATIVNPPILSVPGTQTVVAGSTISFIVNATDGSRTITIAAVTELPSGATFDSTKSYTSGGASSIFTWTPTSSQAGNYTITFKADDGQGGVSTASVTIHVTAPTNAAPLPLLSYSIFGLVGFLIVIGVSLALRRFQTPRRMSKA